jgi:hypothetical protein
MSLLECALAELSSRFKGEVVEITPHMSASNKLGLNQLNGSNLLGMNAGIVALLPCLWQKMKLPRVR